MKKTWLWALLSVLIDGAIFALMIFIGDTVRHIKGPWYVYVLEGLAFGIVMTFTRFLIDKKKSK
jgi:hypothetical protein